MAGQLFRNPAGECTFPMSNFAFFIPKLQALSSVYHEAGSSVAIYHFVIKHLQLPYKDRACDGDY